MGENLDRNTQLSLTSYNYVNQLTFLTAGIIDYIEIKSSKRISILLITDRENPKPAGINSRAGYRSERSEELLARLFIPKG